VALQVSFTALLSFTLVHLNLAPAAPAEHASQATAAA
jgi:hypothetical protein